MKLLPKDYLRMQRPEQFSDSITTEQPKINRSMLEYYLSTLTSRNQEREFEGFAKKLCERTICPNLVSHTGPTGGGDSKVDTETYPISDLSALSFYSGYGSRPAKERWGFAISAKKDWQAKVQADVANIISTERDYKLIYFISNQFIPDKKRAEVQDKLTKQYKVPVWIHDRTWILDTVFNRGFEDLVSSELKIELQYETRIETGPLDVQRKHRKQELEKSVNEHISNEDINPHVVSLMIEHAIVSRELELNRSDVFLSFEKAEEAATNYGTTFQLFDVRYQFAWTVFWWYNDYKLFVDKYIELHSLALKSDNIFIIERLTNLWLNLWTINSLNEDLIENGLFISLTDNLRDKLTSLSTDEEKPSSSLQAKTILIMIDFILSNDKEVCILPVLHSIKDIIIEAKDLLGYPFITTVKILMELYKFAPMSSELDDAYDTISNIVGDRNGEIAKAELDLERARNLLQNGDYYAAIKIIGKILVLLYKNESKKLEVIALFMIGTAFQCINFYWAARGAYLTAASIATDDYWKHGEINSMQMLCYRKVKWCELSIGRVASALEWYKLEESVQCIISGSNSDDTNHSHDHNLFDLKLGNLLLTSSLDTLESYEYLPDLLFDLGLVYSGNALIYSISGSKSLPVEFKSTLGDKEPHDFFQGCIDSEIEQEVIGKLINTESNQVDFKAKILGCNYLVKTENVAPCIEVAESIVACLESTLSTTEFTKAISQVSFFNITVKKSKMISELIEFSVAEDEFNSSLNVLCSDFNPHNLSKTEQIFIRNILKDIIANVMGNVLVIDNLKEFMENLMLKEKVFERSLNFSSSFVVIGNVMGFHPTQRISDLQKKAGYRKYSMNRVEPVHFNTIKKLAQQNVSSSDVELKQDSYAHNNVSVMSIINNKLWDKAKWIATGYVIHDNYPPMIVLVFNDIKIGSKIFSQWKEMIGENDDTDRIRFTIVQGIDDANTYHYRVGISSNLDKENNPSDKSRYAVVQCRINTMTPDNDTNLKFFRQHYSRFNAYYLVPGSINSNGEINPCIELRIRKKEVNMRIASEIQKYELDHVLLLNN